MEFVKTFLIGGIICGLVQILLDKTKLLPGRVMVLLVVLGVILGGVGVYEPFVDFAGYGATVPLIGFGNVLVQGVFQGVKENGLYGIFLGGLTAGAAGISASLVFSYLAAIMTRPKMKK